MKQPLRTLLEELNKSAQVPRLESLYLLSDLDTGDAAQVRDVWPNLPVELRQHLVNLLTEIAEADFEVDFGAIFRIGLEDKDAGVRTTAIEGLWEDQDVRLVPPLIERLHDEAMSVRAAAATSLGRFVLAGELGKIRPGPFSRACEALLAVCQDAVEHFEVRRRALESLSYVDTEDVVTLIREAYEAPQEKVRVSAVFAMGRSADTRWAPQVKQELFSPNPELRYEAARACGELQLSSTVAELAELTEDVDAEVQEAALWALGQIGGDKAREILQRCCESECEATRAAAEAALDELEFLHGDLSDFFDRLAREPGEA
ncbi:MAG: HEAT repeat domain-containing protein [Anaerolineae bacterium]|nr:HEAT repeat domain-containing protein [Anaerolineae bacterium]